MCPWSPPSRDLPFSTGRDVKHIHSSFLVNSRELNTFIYAIASIYIFLCRNTHHKWHIGRNFCFSCLYDFTAKLSQILSIFIFPFICKGRMELMNEVTMGSMDFNRIKSCFYRALYCFTELLHHIFYFICGKRSWCFLALVEWYGRWRDGHGSIVSCTSRMCNLYTNLSSVAVTSFHYLR